MAIVKAILTGVISMPVYEPFGTSFHILNIGVKFYY